MITIGIDPHKDTHAAAAVQDSSGEFLDETDDPATDAGARTLLDWAHGFAGPDAGCASPWRRAATSPVAWSGSSSPRAELVLRVGTRLMVRHPRLGPYHRQVRLDRRPRESPAPPFVSRISRAATHRPELRELKLLVDHREDLVSERTAVVSPLRWHLHELDPDLEPFARTLNREPAPARPLPASRCHGAGVQVRICRELLTRIGDTHARRAGTASRDRRPDRPAGAPPPRALRRRRPDRRPAPGRARRALLPDRPNSPVMPAAPRSRSPPVGFAGTGSLGWGTAN